MPRKLMRKLVDVHEKAFERQLTLESLLRGHEIPFEKNVRGEDLFRYHVPLKHLGIARKRLEAAGD
jgi:hypothetical protein